MAKAEEIEISKYPSKQWEKFIVQSQKFSEVEIAKWRMAEILGYWCFKYKEAFGREYQWKFNSSPSKSYETFRMNTVSSKISSDPKILKEYIDWIFDQKVAKNGKTFRSIAFLVADDNIEWYRTNVLFAGKAGNKIDRSTPLSKDLQSIAAALQCKTYGDLAFAMKANIDSEEMQGVKRLLEFADFDFSILDKIV